MDYVIAIPSYKRATLLKQKTLALLERFGVQKDKIYIFVADQRELEDYSNEINGYNIIEAEKGLVLARRFYNQYFPKNTRILNLDDDCAELKQRTPDAKLDDYRGSFDSLVETGFGICEKQGARLWGINPVANGFFMADTVTVGLRYICGNVHGSYAGDSVISGEDRNLESSGEDFLTTLRSFVKYGSVVRLDWICPTTKYFAHGGIDAELKDKGIMTRQIDHAARLAEIVARYPDLATLVTKAGGVTNIRLKTITYCKLPKTHA